MLDVNAVKDMTFYEALKVVADGGIITKREWNDKELHAMIINEKLHLKGKDGLFHPWIIRDCDMVGEDWIKITLDDED
jgi:hypothetical protein